MAANTDYSNDINGTTINRAIPITEVLDNYAQNAPEDDTGRTKFIVELIKFIMVNIPYWYLYGGAWRDIFSMQTINDLDYCICTCKSSSLYLDNNKKPSFHKYVCSGGYGDVNSELFRLYEKRAKSAIYILEKYGYSVSWVNDGRNDKNGASLGRTYQVNTIIVEKNEYWIEIDCVMPTAVKDCDANINGLIYYGKNNGTVGDFRLTDMRIKSACEELQPDRYNHSKRDEWEKAVPSIIQHTIECILNKKFIPIQTAPHFGIFTGQYYMFIEGMKVTYRISKLLERGYKPVINSYNLINYQPTDIPTDSLTDSEICTYLASEHYTSSVEYNSKTSTKQNNPNDLKGIVPFLLPNEEPASAVCVHCNETLKNSRVIIRTHCCGAASHVSCTLTCLNSRDKCPDNIRHPSSRQEFLDCPNGTCYGDPYNLQLTTPKITRDDGILTVKYYSEPPRYRGCRDCHKFYIHNNETSISQKQNADDIQLIELCFDNLSGKSSTYEYLCSSNDYLPDVVVHCTHQRDYDIEKSLINSFTPIEEIEVILQNKQTLDELVREKRFIYVLSFSVRDFEICGFTYTHINLSETKAI